MRLLNGSHPLIVHSLMNTCDIIVHHKGLHPYELITYNTGASRFRRIANPSNNLLLTSQCVTQMVRFQRTKKVYTNNNKGKHAI
jgi:hypothetical protein